MLWHPDKVVWFHICQIIVPPTFIWPVAQDWTFERTLYTNLVFLDFGGLLNLLCLARRSRFRLDFLTYYFSGLRQVVSSLFLAVLERLATLWTVQTNVLVLDSNRL